MKIRVLIITIIITVAILAIILHTELLGDHATYGQCLVTSSSTSGFSSSSEKSISESQCKQNCVWSENMKSNESQKVSCKFQTISGYGWVASPDDFGHVEDTHVFSPLH